jgi:peptidoglycan/LPS O-acetylase OafA/YrhL
MMKSANYIPTLDGWRAVAIALVLGSHLSPAFENLGSPTFTKIAHFFSHAGYGVDVFFCISGYLICTLLLDEKRRLEGRVRLGRFYTRRAFRILPPLVAYLAALVVLHASGQLPQLSRSEVIAVLAFFRNYSTGSWYTGHFWSLAIEEHFYLIIPLMLSMLRWRSALLVAVFLSVASALWRAIEFRYDIVQPSLPWTFSQFRTENRLDGLMNGAILAFLLHKPRIREGLSRALSPAVWVGLMAITVVALTALTAQPWRRTVCAAILPLIIAHTVLRPNTPAGRFLESFPMRWVGRLSYSLYLWQQLFLIPNYVELAPGPLGLLQRSLLSVFPATACAVASYYLIEKPMIRMGHRLAKSPDAPTPTPTPTPTQELLPVGAD